MSDGGVAQLADHPLGPLEGRSSIHLPAKFFRRNSGIASVFKMGFVHQKAVVSQARHYRTNFLVWKTYFGENMSPASKDRTQSCYYDCVIVTQPCCRK